MKGCGTKDTEGVTIIYSGVQGGRARAGVAVLLSEKAHQFLTQWRCVSERIVTVRLKVKGNGLSFIQV